MATQPPQPPQQGWPKGAAGKELQQTLLPGEQVLGWAEGKMGSHLVATDRRALLVKVGASSGGFFGRKVTVYPYTQLSSVDLRLGVLNCYALLSGPGSQAQTLMDINAQMLADNACAFYRGSEKAFRAVVDILRAQLQAAQQTPAGSGATPGAPAATAGPSIPEQIQQLAHLRDTGILSPAEFEAKKAELLARM